MKYYIDCEFDGHRGALLSLGIVREDGANAYFETGAIPEDPWVIENVEPLLMKHKAEMYAFVPLNQIGGLLRDILAGDDHPVIVADSPVDIARFMDILSTNNKGEWASTNFPRVTAEIHNVNCYPTSLKGAVQHNAWWDAMALRERLKND